MPWRSLCVVGFLTPCLLFGGWFWQKKAKQSTPAKPIPANLTPEQRKEAIKLFSSFIRDIDFTGVVYGSDGKPLEHAKVFADIRQSRRGDYCETQYTDAKGGFHFQYRKNIGFEFQISAPGYYGKKHLRLNEHVTGQTKRGHAFIGAKDVRYVLEKVGPAKPMVKMELPLEFHTRRPWEMWQAAQEKDGEPILLRRPAFHKLDMTGKTPVDLPHFCFYVRAETKDGHIPANTKAVVREETDGPRSFRAGQLPNALYLGITGEGNGIRIWNVPPDTPKCRKPLPLRFLKEAPKDGYTPEVLIDQTHSSATYFTFKIGPWYGKGWFVNGCLRSTSELDEDERVKLRVVILIQPDRTRNIRHPPMSGF